MVIAVDKVIVVMAVFDAFIINAGAYCTAQSTYIFTFAGVELSGQFSQSRPQDHAWV